MKNFKCEPTNDQSLAIQSLSESLFNKNGISLFLLKGYAGRGKTTLMKTLVENLHFNKMLEVDICNLFNLLIFHIVYNVTESSPK